MTSTDTFQDDEIFVACEGIPALVSFKLGGSSKAGKVVPLQGNVLDVAFIAVDAGREVAVISIDNVHQPGSIQEARQEPVSYSPNLNLNTANASQGASRLQYLSNRSGEWEDDKTLTESLERFSRPKPNGLRESAIASEAGRGKADDKAKALRDLLYGVENLRKRPGAED